MRLAVLVSVSMMTFSVSAAAETLIEARLQAINWRPYQDRAVKLLQDYIRIDTSNPPGREIKAAKFFQRLFDEAGIPNTTYAYAPERGNFYAVLKGDGSLRPLILLNHMDVVRTDGQNWKVPPFSGEIVDGEIYGRGAEDMKDEGLLQAMVMLVAAKEKLPLKRDLIFLATADEEVNDSGSAWMIENHPELVRQAEYLITEGGSNIIQEEELNGINAVYAVGVAEKAPFWIRMTATGRSGHGSIPINDSAPDLLALAMARIVEWETPIRLLPLAEEYFHQTAVLQRGGRISQFRNIRKSLKNARFAQQLTDDEHYNYLLRDTVSITVIKSGQQTNVIPETAYCDLDVRLLPGEDPEQFLAALRAEVDDASIQFKPIGKFREPNSSPTDTTLYRIIEQVVHQYNPQALVAPTLNGGYTESQMYRQLGIKCYGFVPIEVKSEDEATEHAANERVPVEQIRRGVKMFCEVAMRAAKEQ
jgi:acetylornithine deacetylase/succinyl-diaminopimelate desuccinylase-like protein